MVDFLLYEIYKNEEKRFTRKTYYVIFLKGRKLWKNYSKI